MGKFILTGKNSLYVLLPFSESKKGLQALEEMLTETNIRAMVREMASVVPTLSEVSLPKMKLLVNTDLRVVLKKLGQIYCFIILTVSFPLITAFKKYWFKCVLKINIFSSKHLNISYAKYTKNKYTFFF